MPAKKGTNSKAEAGRARKAEQAAQKAEKASKEREAQESKEWQKGADLRGQARADAAGRCLSCLMRSGTDVNLVGCPCPLLVLVWFGLVLSYPVVS